MHTRKSKITLPKVYIKRIFLIFQLFLLWLFVESFFFFQRSVHISKISTGVFFAPLLHFSTSWTDGCKKMSNQSDSLFFHASQGEQNMDQNEHIDSPGHPVESGQDSSSWNNAQPGAKRNVSFLKDPGVYEILDLKNNCSYYGESECLLSRLQIHLRQLRNGTHFCKKLQDSFQKTGEKNFQFFVLVSGPEWTSAQKRRDYQDQLIEENSSSCYNQTQSQRYNYPSTVIRPIMYKGRKYNAVRQAVADKKHVSVSRTTLKRQLADPAITDVYYLEEGHVPHGSIPIFAPRAVTKRWPTSVFSKYSSSCSSWVCTKS